MIETLIKKIREKNNPTVVGLDPFYNQIPNFLKKSNSKKDIADCIIAFNKQIIDSVYDIVPAVKPQMAFYEQYGIEGMRALEETVTYAKSKDLFVILDGKRGDIGSTAEGYAKAYLTSDGMDADALTVNGYLGTDGIKPFLDTGRMIFVLGKTSNPSSGELQDLLVGGDAVYEKMALLCETWGGTSLRDERSEAWQSIQYSNCGIVVGATYPEQLKRIREIAPHTFFLVPGYGAQGGNAASLKGAFDENGEGAIVNSSRAILYAYQNEGCDEKDFAGAARREALRMKEELNNVRLQKAVH